MPADKRLIYLEDAERLYVQDGLDVKAIEGILGNKVSRRQLDNWKNIYNWDKKRENHKSKRFDIQNNAIEMVRMASTRYFTDPSKKSMSEVLEAIKICKALGVDLNVKVEGEEKKKAAPKDVAAAVRKLLKVK